MNNESTVSKSSNASGRRRERFKEKYTCRDAPSEKKPELESTGKIIMPPSAADRLVPFSIDTMMFELQKRKPLRVFQCGVLEFTAEEGMIYMPDSMMKNMDLQEGDNVKVKYKTLSDGEYVKLQPRTTDFSEISNPKSFLTTGDRITENYEVDIAPPLDYKELENPTAGDLTFIDESGVKYILDSKISKYLFPHQREGVNWMWKLHGIKGGGGLLADEMGLGKTLTVCSFISGLFHSNLVERIIIITPLTLVPHWTKELRRVGLLNLITNYHLLDPTRRAELFAEFKDI